MGLHCYHHKNNCYRQLLIYIFLKVAYSDKVTSDVWIFLLVSKVALLLNVETNEQTSNSWINDRRHRITASRCYGLYTYNLNKNPKTPNYF